MGPPECQQGSHCEIRTHNVNTERHWFEKIDSAGKTFYHNTQTGANTYEKPAHISCALPLPKRWTTTKTYDKNINLETTLYGTRFTKTREGRFDTIPTPDCVNNQNCGLHDGARPRLRHRGGVPRSRAEFDAS